MMLLKKIKWKSKWALSDFIGKFSSTIPWKNYPGEVRVLCYHGVCADNQPFINGRFVHESQLRETLKALKDKGHFLTAEEFDNKKLSKDRMNFLLTFDDGYENNLSKALPILEELDIPAIFFVTGRQDFLCMDLFDIVNHHGIDLAELYQLMNVPAENPHQLKQKIIASDKATVLIAEKWLSEKLPEKKKEDDVYRDLLSNDDLKVLSNHRLITLANHTFNHLNLTTLNKSELHDEILKCQQRIEELDPFKFRWIAPPYGHYNQVVLDRFLEMDYSGIFVMEKKQKVEGEVIERITVNPFISLRNQLIAINHGRY